MERELSNDHDRCPKTRLRVGAIDYLNARPLVVSLDPDGDPPLEIENHRPSVLAERLARGELDVALVPVVTCVDPAHDWRVLPGISISSWGPVRSIRLYHRAPLESVRRVALDTSSRTSVILTRLLFAKRWGARPGFEPVDPATLRTKVLRDAREPGDAGAFDAALVIGDDALSCGRFPGWDEVDVGLEWTSFTGLPFVYAVWACRVPPGGEDELPPDLAERFLAARWRGFARIDEIVARGRRPDGLSEAECRDYLARTIRYDLGPAEIEGLETFLSLARGEGILPRGGSLRFLGARFAGIA
ncbi:MAG TPA: menaquinone biosynthesis protein [Planctomycetota bacterium]|nr:menaquinone biosynthesis protein [Planctomycetota bacterium]